MKNGFSVQLNIDNRILEYDEDNGLLSCKIPRQMVAEAKKLSFGIISNQAQVELEDFDMSLRQLVIDNKINKTTKAEMFYNDKRIFYGFVNANTYNDNNSVLELKISDVLFLLNYSVIKPNILHNSFGNIYNETIMFYKRLGYDITLDIPQNINDIISYISGFTFGMTGNLYNDWQRFLNSMLCSMSVSDNKIYIRSVVI